MVQRSSTRMQWFCVQALLVLVAYVGNAAALSSPRPSFSSRRNFVKLVPSIAVGSVLGAAPANAAPPIAVIAEELGYFPVTNQKGETVYISKRVQRPSSEQAMELAKKLQSRKAVMYGAYWCPHCARQKELFGREAFALVDYRECSPRGYGARVKECLDQKIDGYPTWKIGKTVLGGERPLSELASIVDFQFQEELEHNVPPPLGSSACKQ